MRLRLRPSLALVALLAVANGCAPEESEDAGADRAAIVGNTRADAERPLVVRLAIGEGATSTCTGTLIGPRTVVTARHCLERHTDGSGRCPVRVLFDRAGVGTEDPSAERYVADRCDIFAPFHRQVPSNDLAMIRLASAIPNAPVAFVADDATPRGRYDVYGYGSWGDGPWFGVLCENHSDGHKRKASYEGRLGFRFGQATCPGDSGGPHFVAGTSILAGLTSTGYAVGIAYEANVDVASHRAWILGQRDAYER